MDQLVAQCWFEAENCAPVYVGAAQRLDMSAVSAFVERGRASLTPVVHPTLPDLVSSLSVKEGTQGDIAKLPCGARSLLLNPESGDIVLRGFNKFFDAASISANEWEEDSSMWSRCRVWAQRKMAGFVVTLFSVDGRGLQLISKHAAVGVHVDMARRVLDCTLTSAQQETVARALFSRHLSLSCECIARGEDYGHPVLEDCSFDQRLIALALQARDSVAELSVPIAETERLVSGWGFVMAPFVELHDAVELRQALQCTSRWSATMRDLGLAHSHDAAPLAEGLVIQIEVPLAALVAQSPGSVLRAEAGAFVRPIRLKAKTIQYTVLRSLRSLITGEVAPRSATSLVRTYHRALLTWCTVRHKDVRSEVEAKGIFALHTEFVQYVSQHRQIRHRNASESVGAAYDRLLALTEKECAPRGHVPLTVVVLTGLPGSGKTSAATQLVASLAEGTTRFDFVVHLSRDSVTRDVMQREHLDAQSSKHKLRRLRGLVHRELLVRLHDVVRFSRVRDAAGLLLLDACHASSESRSMLRRLLPTELDGFHVVYLYCSDAATAVQRLTTRTDHATIHDAQEAQRALYTVRRKYVPPPATQTALSCDTLDTAPQEVAKAILSCVCPADPTAANRDNAPSPHRTRTPTCSVTPQALAMQVAKDSVSILRNLLGEEAASVSQELPTNALSLTPPGRGTVSIKVVLQTTTYEALLSLAARVLHACMFDGQHETAPRVATVTALLQSVRSLITGRERTTSPLPLTSVHLAGGHLKWLPNWLFGRGTDRHIEDLRRALQERFTLSPQAPPHVTLFYPSSHASRQARQTSLDAWWRHTQMQKASLVNVQVEELLLDRLGICFRVTLPQKREHQWEEQGGRFVNSPLALHVTLGVASGTRPAYCGEMASLFTTWEVSNAVLERHKADKLAVRSKEKFHNFARITFEPLTVLRGVVVDSDE